MTTYSETRQLDLFKRKGRAGGITPVTLRRGECGAKIIAEVTLSGDAFDLTGYTAKYMAMNALGDYIEQNAQIDDATAGLVSYEVTSALTAEAGPVLVSYFELAKDDEVTTTDTIPLIILDNADITAQEAEEYQRLIDNLVTQLQQALTAATEAADNANAKAALADGAATSASAAAATAGEKAGLANEAAQAADAAREAIQDDLAAKADAEGYYPLLGVGMADALPTGDTAVDTFARRVSEHDGACRIEGIRGNTVRWSQLFPAKTFTYSGNGFTITSNGDYKFVVTVTAESATNSTGANVTSISTNIVSGHKYLYRCKNHQANIRVGTKGNGTYGEHFITAGSSFVWSNIAVLFEDLPTGTYEVYTQIYDLTNIFGAGNEPTTIAEFERMFPEPCYPYDAGSLLSVNIEGMKTAGYNQWDEDWELGRFDTTTGANVASNSQIRSKNHIPVTGGSTYYFQTPVAVWAICYDDNGSTVDIEGTYNRSGKSVKLGGENAKTVTIPHGAVGMRFYGQTSYGTTYNHDICINISNPALNGAYRPYVDTIREIPPSSLFADGILRSAGAAYDERTPTVDIKRIGVVDLGSLSWEKYSYLESYAFRATVNDIRPASSGSTIGNAICAEYQTIASTNVNFGNPGIAVSATYNMLYLVDTTLSALTAEEVKSELAGAMLYYELATPTSVAIGSPLNMTYPVEAGGTESIVIPTGSQSAPPTMDVMYAYSADIIRDESQSIVAPVEYVVATTNYSVGSYLVKDGTLYRVTSAIASGATITPGTNVTATTVMAELMSAVAELATS